MADKPEGYIPWDMSTPDPFEEKVGPFYVKDRGDGTWASAFRVRGEHLNMGGALHGGMLMTFADQAAFAISRRCWNTPDVASCVTVSMTSDFVAAAFEGDLLEASGEVVRETRSLIFVRGRVESGDKTVLTFSAILKKTAGRKTA